MHTHTHIRIQTTQTQTYIPINASIGRSSIESGDGDFDSSSLCFSSSPSSSNPVSAIIRPRSLVILSASSDCYGHNLYYDTKKLQFIFYLIRTRSFYFRTIFIKRYFIHLQNKLIYHYNELLNSLLQLHVVSSASVYLYGNIRISHTYFLTGMTAANLVIFLPTSSFSVSELTSDILSEFILKLSLTQSQSSAANLRKTGKEFQ